MLNYIAHSAYYFYLLAYFVFIFLAIRKINVTLFQTRNPSEPVFKVILSSSVTTKLATTGNSVFSGSVICFLKVSKEIGFCMKTWPTFASCTKKKIAPEGHEFPKNALQFAEVFRL